VQYRCALNAREVTMSYRILLPFLMLLPGSAMASNQDLLSAQGFAGIDDSGNCVQPCARSGGRPCAPCLPVIGPGSPQWQAAVAATAAANDEFEEAIRALAAKDSGYRRSIAYNEDRQLARRIDKSVDAMREVQGAEMMQASPQ
jgi:hypothetical protein